MQLCGQRPGRARFGEPSIPSLRQEPGSRPATKVRGSSTTKMIVWVSRHAALKIPEYQADQTSITSARDAVRFAASTTVGGKPVVRF
jgi:hypothetical protein